MELFKFTLVLIVIASLSATLSSANPGFNTGWGGHGGRPFSLFPEFYQFSCPQANDIVMSVLERAIANEPRIAASLLRVHFHDCFVQVLELFHWLQKHKHIKYETFSQFLLHIFLRCQIVTSATLFSYCHTTHIILLCAMKIY